MSASLAGLEADHVGMVVPDILATQSMLGGLGARLGDPFDFTIDSRSLTTGDAGTVRVMLAELGSLRLECIQPIRGDDTVWARSLRERGPGLHHVAFMQLEGLDEHVDALHDIGFTTTLMADFGPKRSCYLEFGPLVIELSDGPGLKWPRHPGI